nr:hypothetical protein BEI47_10435 [Aliivibrio fischeri]
MREKVTFIIGFLVIFPINANEYKLYNTHLLVLKPDSKLVMIITINMIHLIQVCTVYLGGLNLLTIFDGI